MRWSDDARPLRLWVPIPRGAWMFVCCVCYVLLGRDLWYELIPRPEESYRLWCIIVCDLETFRMSRHWPSGGCRVKNIQLFNLLPGFTYTNSVSYFHKHSTPFALASTAIFLLSLSCWDNGFKSLQDVDDSCESLCVVK